MKNKIDVLFRKYADDCLYSSSLRDETVRGYTHVFGYFQRLMPEVTTVDQLDGDVMRDFFKRAKQKTRDADRGKMSVGLRNSSLATYRYKLQPFFKWLIENDYMEQNPLKGMKAPKVRYTDNRALSSNDIEKLHTAAALHSSSTLMRLRDTCMIALLYYTGVRRGELQGLRVMDVNLDRRRLRIRPETSKSGEERMLPINPELAGHLKDYLSERRRHNYTTPALFVSASRDGGLTLHGLKHWVKRMEQKSGVKFHLHRFRHSFACALAKDNVQFVKIQKLMGHVDPEMTLQYMRSIKTDDCENEVFNMTLSSLKN